MPAIQDVLRRHEHQLTSLPNVTGVGIGEKQGREIIIVFVKEKVPESRLEREEVIPKTLEGYEVKVRPQINIGK